jgi:exopolyphosphatase/guanosine-5'-triphosphate,3'-diphosphate pyrophosphatase
MKSVHGMGRRERLLLRLAAILQDCGKFINMTNVGECSFAIIANTEIIGLSHNERIIVASVVKYNHGPFEYYPEMSGRIGVDRRSYLTIAKLTAILQLANALDKGKGEKIKKIDAALEKDELRIYVDAKKDMLYEQERFDKRSGFFEEVYGVHPKLYRMKNK